MSPCPPPFAISAAALGARHALPSLRDGTADVAMALAYCRWMRIAAVGKLLLTGRPRELFADLERSAQAFAHFVSHRSGTVAAGRAAPFFDAVACGDAGSAAAIARGTARTWQQGQEYEDDFVRMRFLMDLHTSDEATSAERLARCVELLEAPDPRLGCCTALRDRDAAALDRSLRAASAAERAADEELSIEGRLDPDEAVTTAHVYCEGLAIVQLAERHGIAVARELPRIPSLARRLDLRTPLAPNAWQDVEDLGIVA